MSTIDKRVHKDIKCDRCKNKQDGCKESCEKYIATTKAYLQASKILEDASLGIPRNEECRSCKSRTLGCHSTCEGYLLLKAYGTLIGEIKQKEKIARSVQHMVGLPGLPHKYRRL